MDDASLDDFVESEDERSESSETVSGEERPANSEDERSESSENVSGETANSADPPAEAETTEQSVEPAETTYQWSAEEVTCTACGSSVARRWQTDEGLVCPDCKEW